MVALCSYVGRNCHLDMNGLMPVALQEVITTVIEREGDCDEKRTGRSEIGPFAGRFSRLRQVRDGLACSIGV